MRTENRYWRTLRVVVWVVAIGHFADLSAQTQGRTTNSPLTSDLTRQNLSRVAAPAAEIKSVLQKDPGLMVELKRWAAKDAADHGQIVTESDLSDYVIFDRLDDDVQFRSVATALVQRFGYLVPKLNPESDLAREQDLIRIERAKWIAQSQEEERGAARQRSVADTLEKAKCEQTPTAGCVASQAQPDGQPGGTQQIDTLPSAPYPPDLTIPNFVNPPTNQMDRAQLTQTGQDSGGGMSLSPLGGANSSGSSGSMNNVGMDGSTSSSGADSDQYGSNRQLAAVFNSGNSQGSGPDDGLLSAYGLGQSRNSMPNFSSMSPRASVNASGSTPLIPMQPSRRGFNLPTAPAPEMIRSLSPYRDIPSLYDMYVQAVTRPTTPRRFGADIFENGSRDLQMIPMDLPAGPDYVVGPGDGLAVDLFGGVSLRLSRVVDREGRVSLPEIGPISVSGKSLSAIQQDLQQLLKAQFHNVSVDVSLSRLRTIRVYEVGDIANPGAYDISSLSTPLNALFVAGGPTARGSLRIVNHFRGNQLLQTVDLYDLLLHGVRGNIERLENGDSVQVPSIGAQVTIEGMVRRPAIYELRDEKTLASVLELAGGVLPTAALRHIEVQRIVAHDKQTMLSVDIPDTDDSSEVAKKLESFVIQDGDRIRIYPIAPYNQDAIYLDGHVVRPGRYSFRPNMRVTDVISSYKDLLPEPSTAHAEIIRLNAPDFRPSVESFDLASALADPSKAPVLHPMDTLRIFSRFDFEDPPVVSVMGSVRVPGTYRTSGEIRLADAIHLAGGLDLDAKTADAQVFRYLPDGRFKIFSVSLGSALTGDPVENIVLQSRDRLLVHRNSEAVEQSVVYIQGEVSRPGRYPLTTNMHVGDLIRVGGGLKPSADTQTADLMKYEWSSQKKMLAAHEDVPIAAVLAGDSTSNVSLTNGDVVTIRQLPGWNDLGASITLRGEVKHPGTYGIRPGERLSSIIERAGGFQPDAYPYGAVLQRAQVRDVESKERDGMILRIKDAENSISMGPENDPKQKQTKAAAMEQYQTTLEQLNANPPSGRVSIRINSSIERWKNTVADVEVRSSDTLTIPKKASYVMVSGQVYNPTAISFRAGKSANWYLNQGGGPTLVGDRRSIFVIRADGSVIGGKKGLWSGDSLNAALQPGDTVVVPEKALGGSIQWQMVFSAAQLATSVSTAIFYALHY